MIYLKACDILHGYSGWREHHVFIFHLIHLSKLICVFLVLDKIYNFNLIDINVIKVIFREM